MNKFPWETGQQKANKKRSYTRHIGCVHGKLSDFWYQNEAGDILPTKRAFEEIEVDRKRKRFKESEPLERIETPQTEISQSEISFQQIEEEPTSIREIEEPKKFSENYCCPKCPEEFDDIDIFVDHVNNHD